VDYGKPVNVNSITLTPLGDGNTIEPGDTYELFYWDYEWKSLGTSTAKTISLHYDNRPSNALLLLVDKTKGQEHRIFMLSESSTQIFL
jgi:hypothetical protein